MNQSTTETPRRVRVFREGDFWDGHSDWWSLPLATLQATYLDDWVMDDDFVSPKDEQFIRSHYDEPVVLVY